MLTILRVQLGSGRAMGREEEVIFSRLLDLEGYI